MTMTDHQHSFTCLEEIGGNLVCRTQAKQLTVKDLPKESYAAQVLSSPAARRPSILNPRKLKKVTSGHSSLDEPRIRFNWGYHDGARDSQAGKQPTWKSPHYDPVYEAGYRKGRSHVEVTGTYTGNSEDAWNEYTHGRTILTRKGSFQSTFYLRPTRYDSRGENYETVLSAYKAWMDRIQAGADPSTAKNEIEAATGQHLHLLSAKLTGDLRRSIAASPSSIHLVLTSESPTGKNTKNVHETKGIRA